MAKLREADADKPQLIVWWKDEFDEYRKPGHDGWLENASWKVPDQQLIFDTNLRRVVDVQEAAELYAEYFHDNRDGYENTWPLKFVVSDGARYWAVEVDRDFVVEFGACGEPTEMPEQEVARG